MGNKNIADFYQKELFRKKFVDFCELENVINSLVPGLRVRQSSIHSRKEKDSSFLIDFEVDQSTHEQDKAMMTISYLKDSKGNICITETEFIFE